MIDFCVCYVFENLGGAIAQSPTPVGSQVLGVGWWLLKVLICS